MAFVARKLAAGDRSVDCPCQDVIPPVVPSRYFRWVGLASRLAAAILLIPALPVIILLIMLVHITSPGPGIYRQRRVGLHGRVFTLYKIRTMLKDAEAKTGPVWTAPNDPRITRLGRLLRPLHLDELPQLFNVLRGQMTLIGPRPERPEFTQRLAEVIPGYMNRYCVMPGITGLAQVNLPPDNNIESVRRKVVLDLDYIREANFRLDLRIFFCTALKLFGVPGKSGVRLFHLERQPIVPDYMYAQVGATAEEGDPAPYATPADNVAANAIAAKTLRVKLARHEERVPATH